MNTLQSALVWALLQVTLLGLTAVPLYLFAAWRDPRTGKLVTAGSLAAILVLTLLAVLPLPAWWTWSLRGPRGVELPTTAARELAASTDESEPFRAEPGAAADELRRWSSWLLGLWRGGEVAAPAEHPRGWDGARVLTTAMLTCSACCLLRVLLGVWAVRRWRTRSWPIADPALLHLLDTLRVEMGCHRAVQVRGSAELTGPVTVGWRRPLLLLPTDWHTWSAAELRAVLAHELAHVRSADYLTGLLARISVALHCYHPLVWWLANRLHLQQELAADALGADFAGGRASYLRALARLALRQEDRPVFGPARAFLPAPGTLMRRIDMLRSKEAKRNLWCTWLRRGVALGVLLGTALSVSGLRGPATAARAEEPKEPAQTQNAAAPFDLTYVDENAFGLLAFRPAAFFAQPGMKPLADMANQLTEVGLIPLVFKKKLDLRVEDIEQIIGDWVHTYDEKAAAGARNSVMARIVMIRTVRPFDWKAKLQDALGVELVEERQEGQVFWKALAETQSVLPAGFMVYIPDDRTLVMPNSKEIHRILRRGKDAQPKFLWGETWKLVDRGWFAMALHNTDQRWLQSLKEDGTNEKELALLAPILTNTRSIAFGIDGTEHVFFHALAECETEEKCEAVVKAAQAAVALGRTTTQLAALKKDLKPVEAAALQFATDLTKNAKFGRLRGPDGQRVVRVEADAKTKLGELLAEFARAEMKAESSGGK